MTGCTRGTEHAKGCTGVSLLRMGIPIVVLHHLAVLGILLMVIVVEVVRVATVFLHQ